MFGAPAMMLANVEATVTIVCGTILAIMQAYTTYRLKEQDNARDAARLEMARTAATVKDEAVSVAARVENKVNAAAEKTAGQLKEIHVLVNTRLSEALERVLQLEAKLGLARDEAIPNPPTITNPTEPDA